MLDVLISRCQVMAGPLADSSVPEVRAGLDRLVEALPGAARPEERLLIRGLVTQVLGRVLENTGIGGRHDVAGAFVAWAASSATGTEWRRGVCGLIGRCSSALAVTTAPCPAPVPDVRIAAALRVLDARFNDPSLTRQEFASAMHLSVWHASRLLKEQTGFGFVAHTHQRRIDVAETMLRNRCLSVKEIAVAVGYGSASQLDRHFRRLRGMTPLEYRNLG